VIVLDTNIISELMRTRPADRVRTWADERVASELFTTSIAEAEVRYGIALLPKGKRRDALAGAARVMFSEGLRWRVLPFTSDAAEHYADIAAVRRRSGRPISTLDAQIGAIARAHGATLATRNVSDFEDCGIDLLDPWH
jgi:predicted nucleic acid-binding protein